MKETSKDPMGTPYRNLGLTNKLQSFLYRKSGIAITVTVLFLMLILYIQHQLSRNMDTFSSNDVMTRHSSFYGIMLDAGSTGSRVHVYEFQKTNETIILLDELFEQVSFFLVFYYVYSYRVDNNRVIFPCTQTYELQIQKSDFFVVRVYIFELCI